MIFIDVFVKVGFLLVFAVLLAGCINMTTEQKLAKDGSSEVVQTADVSPLLNQLATMQASMNVTSESDPLANMNKQFDEVCKNITRKDSTVKCTNNGKGVIKISKSITKEEGNYKFTTRSEFPNIVYVFDTDQLPEMPSASDADSSSSSGSFAPQFSINKLKFNDESAKTGVASLSMMKAKMTYIIEMPGTIQKAENGEIKDGKAVYDVLKLIEDGKTVHVESSELDTGSLVIAVAVFVVFGVAIVFFVIILLLF